MTSSVVFESVWNIHHLGHPPIHDADLAPYIPDIPGESSKLTWMQRLKLVMVYIHAAPGLWAERPSVGLARVENVRDATPEWELF